MKTRLTIQDLVPAYARIGISSAHAVKYIVESRMRSGLSGGHGNRAKRRQKRSAVESCQKRRVFQQPLDVVAEQFTEGRTHKASAALNRKNIHD